MGEACPGPPTYKSADPRPCFTTGHCPSEEAAPADKDAGNRNISALAIHLAIHCRYEIEPPREMQLNRAAISPLIDSNLF